MPRPAVGAHRVLRGVGAAAALGGVLACATPSGAQELGDLADLTILGWSLTNVRAGARLAPDYIGSDDYRLLPSGSISLSRRGAEPSLGPPDDGVSVGLIGGSGWTAGLSARWRSARDNEYDLEGFEEVDWAVEAGGYVNLWPVDWLRVRAELRHGLGGHHAWVADLAADAVLRRSKWVVSAGPRLSWGDDGFTRTYFSVDPIEAASSPFGIAPYAPDGPALAAGVQASAERRLSRHWSVTAVANYRRLLGDAADSPVVVDLGSRDQFSTTLSVRYWF